MANLTTNVAALYVNRSSRQWIVLDGEGNYWTVPAADENPWEQRQPFYPDEETDLERVPTHYKQTLGLPIM